LRGRTRRQEHDGDKTRAELATDPVARPVAFADDASVGSI
jgi:hypothetical protein